MADVVPEQSVIKTPEAVTSKPADVKSAEKSPEVSDQAQEIIRQIDADQATAKNPDDTLRDIAGANSSTTITTVETKAPGDKSDNVNTPAKKQHEFVWISKYDQDEINALEKKAHEDPGSLIDSDWEQIIGNRDEYDEHKYQNLIIDQDNGVQLNEEYQNFINAYEEEQSKLADGTLTKEARIQKLKQDTNPDYALKDTAGAKPPASIQTPDKPALDIAEIEKGPEYHVSNHDRFIVIAMMNPERQSIGATDRVTLYDTLVGEKPKSERSRWQQDDQHLAQEGMAELIAAELDEIIPSGQTVDITKARQYLLALQDPNNKNWIPYLKSKGKGLAYQNLSARDFDALQKQGDFLHFGINTIDPNAPDLLPSSARVYVNPKLSAVGHITAEVIRMAREKGYNPYGKVWDESSSAEPISERRDRILFFPSTQSQVDIITGALADIQAQHPELFEKDVPLLAEKTDIPGVGLAEEPVQTSEFKMSFNGSREDIVGEAWEATLGTLTGRNEEIVVVGGAIVDRRNILVREAIRNGKLGINEQIVPAFRQAVRELSPKYHISSDNFARNQSNTIQPTVAN